MSRGTLPVKVGDSADLAVTFTDGEAQVPLPDGTWAVAVVDGPTRIAITDQVTFTPGGDAGTATLAWDAAAGALFRTGQLLDVHHVESGHTWLAVTLLESDAAASGMTVNTVTESVAVTTTPGPAGPAGASGTVTLFSAANLTAAVNDDPNPGSDTPTATYTVDPGKLAAAGSSLELTAAGVYGDASNRLRGTITDGATLFTFIAEQNPIQNQTRWSSRMTILSDGTSGYGTGIGLSRPSTASPADPPTPTDYPLPSVSPLDVTQPWTISLWTYDSSNVSTPSTLAQMIVKFTPGP